ncbi:hypothetical protein KC19_VG235200 [Ceratodon purpureus]|uniref:Uncharacterized protein n=1 Tax=Ceratodon purpureus TaxID=3225 RepID=A0A8T0HUB2_CERPU|nr:hypothetical protein KC19_VG235200 [Ceratodon purpureus]
MKNCDGPASFHTCVFYVCNFRLGCKTNLWMSTSGKIGFLKAVLSFCCWLSSFLARSGNSQVTSCHNVRSSLNSVVLLHLTIHARGLKKDSVIGFIPRSGDMVLWLQTKIRVLVSSRTWIRMLHHLP